jgi:hypothetical protein
MMAGWWSVLRQRQLGSKRGAAYYHTYDGQFARRTCMPCEVAAERSFSSAMVNDPQRMLAKVTSRVQQHNYCCARSSGVPV